MLNRYNGAEFESDDTPSSLTPLSQGSVVNHENFPEFVRLTVKKQLETNLLPLVAHVRTAFEAVVPLQMRSNLAPQQLRCRMARAIDM